MRNAILNAALLLSVALPVLASPKPCSDHPGVVHSSDSPYYVAPASGGSSSSSGSNSGGSSSSGGGKGGKKQHPKVSNPTVGSVTGGTSQAINQFAPYLPSDLQSQLSNAINQAIKEQLAHTAVVTVTATTTVTQTGTPKPHHSSNVTVVNGTTTTIALGTATITGELKVIKSQIANKTTTTIGAAPTDPASLAVLNIEKAIDSAFAAVNMSQSGLNADTIASLQTCLNAVMTAGGMPSGFSCLTQSGSTGTGLSSTLRTTLEQFVGILPNSLITNMFDAVDPLLSALLPASEYALIQQIQDSIASVIATVSGSSVTALEQAQDCYTTAIQQQGNTSALQCFAKSSENTLSTAANGVIESFVGVLPASLMTSVQNILAYNLANTSDGSSASLAAKVQAQISNALNSAASTLSGNTVSLAETLQACTSQLLLTGNATAAKECITASSAPALSESIVLGIAEQYQGYLPSSFFTDLVDESQKLLNTSANAQNRTQAQINSAFESFFNNATSYGAAYVSCLSQIQNCVTNAITKSGTVDAICPGPSGTCKISSVGSRLIRKSVPSIESRMVVRRATHKQKRHHDALPAAVVEMRSFESSDDDKLSKRDRAVRLGKMLNLERLRRS